ncbi:hypothetical protein Tco_0978776 [Tanacetum coccineum]|uniref:Uncharacterized protein n=1 Tax=Tanacetum coccineum TaxID=301880 RepID=A0ABQ5EP84_9ASTR
MGGNVYIQDLVDFDVTMSTSKEKYCRLLYLVWFMKYSAYVRRIVADSLSKLKYKFQDKENLEDIFSYGSALDDFIYVVFVLDRNIVYLIKDPLVEAFINEAIRPFKNTTGLKADEAGWGSNKSDHTENYSRSEAYSWGQKVVSGNEAALGANKTKNETEKGREQVLEIKRWSVGMRLREVQTRWKNENREEIEMCTGMFKDQDEVVVAQEEVQEKVDLVENEEEELIEEEE